MIKNQQRATGAKTIGRVTCLGCASLLLLCTSIASAQETGKPASKTKASAEEKKTVIKVGVEARKIAEQVHAEALQFSRNGDYIKAAELLAPYAQQQPLAYVPITGDYLVFIIWSGDNLKATQEFEKLPANFPKSTYLRRNMAKAYYDQNNFEPAAALYAETLKLAPADEEAQKGVVLSLYHAGKKKEAADKLDEYMKANPESATLKYLKPQISQ